MKRKSPQNDGPSVRAKKKANAEIEVQCELGSNVYRLALQRTKKTLPLSPVPHFSVNNLILYVILLFKY